MDNDIVLNTKDLTTEQKGDLACSLRGQGCNCCQAVIMAFKGLLKYEDKPIRGNSKQLITDFKNMSKATSCRDLKGIDTGVMLTSCEDCMKNAVKALAAQL